MNITLSASEARVLGVLIEKEATTPDTYPMSLNAITLGCNQKSNREPVMNLGESEVQAAIDGLIKATLAREMGGAGGRVARYGHRLATRLFGEFEFSAPQRAVLCVLLLRGPQTPEEIRARVGRLFAFTGIAQVESVLRDLAARADGPYAVELAREPGRRESRHAHLLCGPVAAARAPSAAQDQGSSGTGTQAEGDDARIARIEQRLAAVEAQLARLSAVADSIPDAEGEVPPE